MSGETPTRAFKQLRFRVMVIITDREADTQYHVAFVRDDRVDVYAAIEECTR